jgi:spore maturation protein CgeB
MVPRAYFLPFAFSVDVLESLEGFERDRYASDICFIGAPFRGSRRVGVIDRNAAFLSEFHVRLMGATAVDTWKANLANYDVVRAGVVDEFIEPKEANRFFASATINLNLHKDQSGHLWDRNSRAVEAISPNERFFAIAGTGAFQLVDAGRAGLRELFPSHLIEEFATDEAFRERITHFLTHEDERNAVAGELGRIVLRDHTYDSRIERMLALLRS